MSGLIDLAGLDDAALAALTAGAGTRTAVKTGAYTASAGDLVPVDTTAGNVTVTLPTAPADKAKVTVKHIIQGGTNTVTVACGGSDVLNKAGGSTSATLTLVNQGATYEYQTSTHVWTVTAGDLPLSGLNGTYAQITGVPTVMTIPNGKTGIFDWEYGQGGTGYLLHFRSGSSSVSTEYAIGIGTDAGSGGGLLIDHKNAGGAGVRLDQQPGSGNGFTITNRSSSPHFYADHYAGSGGIMLAVKSGQGYADGVTNGTTTFTSATASFTSGDIGAAITSLQPTSSAIAAGTTITAVTNSTTVTLSQAAPSTATGVRFNVAGRAPASSLPFLRIFDTDSGSTLLYDLRKGYFALTPPVQAMSASNYALDVRATTSQSNDIFRVRTATPFDALTVTAAGVVTTNYRAAFANAADTTQSVASFRNYGTGTGSAPGIIIWSSASTNEASDGLRIVDSTAATTFYRFNRNGYPINKKTAAPADTEVSANEMAIWFDSTNGAAKLMVKGKSANGTVVTGSMALA